MTHESAAEPTGTTPPADERLPGALVRSAVTTFLSPERTRLATLELVPHVVNQLTWGRGADRRAVATDELGIGEPPAILFARTVEQARTDQEHEYQLIGAEDGLRMIRVATDGEPIVSPIFLLPEILTELEEEPDFSLAGADIVVSLTSPTDLLLVDANDRASLRAAVSMAIKVYQEHPQRVTPLPYRWVEGRLERFDGGDDPELAELIGQTGIWFHQLQHSILREFYEEGPGRDWFSAQSLRFVNGARENGRQTAHVRASDFANGAQLLVPVVEDVVLHQDVDDIAGLSEVTAPLERLHTLEVVTMEPGMRPHMFRFAEFPSSYQMSDLARAEEIARIGERALRPEQGD